MPCVHAAALPRNVLELAVVPAGGFEGIMDVDSDVALACLVAPAMRAHINQRWGHALGTIFSLGFQGGLPEIQSTAAVLGSHSAAARAAPEEIMPFRDQMVSLRSYILRLCGGHPARQSELKPRKTPASHSSAATAHPITL